MSDGPNVRQRVRDASRVERGRCVLAEAFLTEWEFQQVREFAVRCGVSLEVMAGDLVRRGLDGLQVQETESNGQQAKPAA